MKKYGRIAAAVLLGAVTAMIGPCGSFAAADGAVSFSREAGPGDYWGYELPVQSYGAGLNDLFGDVTKELVPGDERTVRVRLGNRGASEAYFYLRAEALPIEGGEADEKLSDGARASIAAVKDAFGDKAAMDALLENIGVAVTYKGAEIYSGTLGGTAEAGAPESALYGAGAALGTLAPGGYGDIELSLKVSESLGNSYFNALCAVDWIFTATQEDPPLGGGDGGGGGGGGGSGGGTIGESLPPLDDGQIADIEDEGTPMATLLDGPEDPELVIIADPNTPLALPQTGGLLTYATPAAIALAALVALYAALSLRDRKRRAAAR
ncbi:MAG: hypothetical protein LBS32_00805 [Clostridiales Family XIII bacterium]|jgi:hypothetical protein|nr:hypothetical protein [Clostridiales Family XIII bacterium]